MITRAAVSAVELEQLIEEFSQFKSDTASELMRQTYVRNQQEQRRKMLAKLEDNSLQAESQVRSLVPLGCCKHTTTSSAKSFQRALLFYKNLYHRRANKMQNPKKNHFNECLNLKPLHPKLTMFDKLCYLPLTAFVFACTTKWTAQYQSAVDGLQKCRNIFFDILVDWSTKNLFWIRQKENFPILVTYKSVKGEVFGISKKLHTERWSLPYISLSFNDFKSTFTPNYIGTVADWF